MDFENAARRFGLAASGSDTFKTLSRDMFDLMRSDAANAGFYFVIGVAARAYVKRYEDQEVSGQFADSAQSTLVAFCNRVAEALARSPGERMDALSLLTIDYEFGVIDF